MSSGLIPILAFLGGLVPTRPRAPGDGARRPGHGADRHRAAVDLADGAGADRRPPVPGRFGGGGRCCLHRLPRRTAAARGRRCPRRLAHRLDHRARLRRRRPAPASLCRALPGGHSACGRRATGSSSQLILVAIAAVLAIPRTARARGPRTSSGRAWLRVPCFPAGTAVVTIAATTAWSVSGVIVGLLSDELSRLGAVAWSGAALMLLSTGAGAVVQLGAAAAPGLGHHRSAHRRLLHHPGLRAVLHRGVAGPGAAPDRGGGGHRRLRLRLHPTSPALTAVSVAAESENRRARGLGLPDVELYRLRRPRRGGRGGGGIHRAARRPRSGLAMVVAGGLDRPARPPIRLPRHARLTRRRRLPSRMLLVRARRRADSHVEQRGPWSP